MLDALDFNTLTSLPGYEDYGMKVDWNNNTDAKEKNMDIRAMTSRQIAIHKAYVYVVTRYIGISFIVFSN